LVQNANRVVYLVDTVHVDGVSSMNTWKNWTCRQCSMRHRMKMNLLKNFLLITKKLVIY